MVPRDEIRESVRQHYAAAAARPESGTHDEARRAEVACCGGVDTCADGHADHAAGELPGHGTVAGAFGAVHYDPDVRDGVPDAAIAASLGCGVPTAVAELHPGETVLDLGSGAGADVLIAARRVEPGGRAIGLDMTDEMLEVARSNADSAAVSNVEFLHGHLEDIPLPDGSVDVIISNCVINLAADKDLVLREAARVLRPGGRVAISDVLADSPPVDDAGHDPARWAGCIAGALTEARYRDALSAAGFVGVEIRRTHRVDAHAEAAIVRAHLPATARR